MGALRQPRVLVWRPKGVRQGVGQSFFHVSAFKGGLGGGWGGRERSFHRFPSVQRFQPPWCHRHFRVFKVAPPGSGQLAGGATLQTLKLVVPPSFSKFSKFSPGTLAGGGTLKTLKTPSSNCSKLVLRPGSGFDTLNSLKMGGPHAEFKVFKVGPSARVITDRGVIGPRPTPVTAD